MAKAKASAPAVVADPAALVPVRVLVDSVYGKCNTLGHVPADQLDAAAGIVDAAPEAVAAVSK